MALASFLFLYFNEMEDEVVRDRSKNKPTIFIKWYSKISNIKLTTGANAKWYEPIEPYVGNYYPKFMKTPNHRERFKYSSTIGVFITDLEHWYQFCKLRSINILTIIVGFYISYVTDIVWYEAQFIFIANLIGTFSFTFIKESFIKSLN